MRLKVSQNAEDFFTGIFIAPFAIIAIWLLIIAPIWAIVDSVQLMGGAHNFLRRESVYFGIIGGGINILLAAFLLGASLTNLPVKSTHTAYPFEDFQTPPTSFHKLFPLSYLATIILAILLCVTGFLLTSLNPVIAGICFIVYMLLGFLMFIACGIVMVVFYRN